MVRQRRTLPPKPLIEWRQAWVAGGACHAWAMSQLAGPPVDRALLDEAVGLARRAGEFTLQHFRNADLAIDTKGDGTPVTVADRAAERSSAWRSARGSPMTASSARRRPRSPARPVGAGSSTRSTAPRRSPTGCRCTPTCWPCRTSTASASGSSTCPALGETIYAGRGLGAWCNDERIHVNDTARPRAATYDLGLRLGGRPARRGHRRRGAPAHLGRRVRLRAGGHRSGRGDGRRFRRALRPRAHAGDHGRGRRALHRPDRGDRRRASGSGLATNGEVHDELLAIFSSRRRTSDGRPVET